ncbi:UbiX family flavin prenyltransferase [Mariprofundus erugo]|uniref:UbiX family flavin prenyltransferase n=1 Tax=Mariprofundus erugo TaxID=2528639 RepID=UPI0010FF09E5|nr:flavin prenyltransferase UbiX [Mariprofundus erugo]TLS76695.1 UbiX family flavin prenyltransferase [Mariprofundus erugo]
MNFGTKATEPVIIAVTGASGSCYALRLIQRLAAAGVPLHILLSDAARVVLDQELDLKLPADPAGTAAALAEHVSVEADNIHCYATRDWFSPAASGSAGIRRMIIIPCSMGTLAHIANGASDNLIERAADVMIKERGQLILVPRETPLSAIHLENMLKLARLGVEIIPAMPGFYHRPESLDDIIDFVVDRVLHHIEMPNPAAKKWGMA